MLSMSKAGPARAGRSTATITTEIGFALVKRNARAFTLNNALKTEYPNDLSFTIPSANIYLFVQYVARVFSGPGCNVADQWRVMRVFGGSISLTSIPTGACIPAYILNSGAAIGPDESLLSHRGGFNDRYLCWRLCDNVIRHCGRGNGLCQ